MVNGETNSSEATLNLLQSAPPRQQSDDKMSFTKQITSKETATENNKGVETVLTTCYSRIKKRRRSSNIL